MLTMEMMTEAVMLLLGVMLVFLGFKGLGNKKAQKETELFDRKTEEALKLNKAIEMLSKESTRATKDYQDRLASYRARYGNKPTVNGGYDDDPKQ